MRHKYIFSNEIRDISESYVIENNLSKNKKEFLLNHRLKIKTILKFIALIFNKATLT